MNTRKMTSAILVTMVALFSCACGISTPIPTPTPVVKADCFLSFQLAAWQDLDGDGMRDASEPPLEGVEFRLRGTFAQIWGYPYLSEEDGRLTITTWTPGWCPETERDFTVTAVPPESYEPTTPTSITFSLTPTISVYKTQFGFRAVSK